MWCKTEKRERGLWYSSTGGKNGGLEEEDSMAAHREFSGDAQGTGEPWHMQ